jgi:hypothetical protein
MAALAPYDRHVLNPWYRSVEISHKVALWPVFDAPIRTTARIEDALYTSLSWKHLYTVQAIYDSNYIRYAIHSTYSNMRQ